MSKQALVAGIVTLESATKVLVSDKFGRLCEEHYGIESLEKLFQVLAARHPIPSNELPDSEARSRNPRHEEHRLTSDGVHDGHSVAQALSIYDLMPTD